ncbi:hypothetical protein H4R18_000603 [Coemansia javaensis]|uniref:Uncharacterized protein n=1 Tax=Coemansia javaensis TaxID=2761396 RepID=A0A9W8LMJ0_9FUNG|nr:hypothetical protein H4R18_000603 [Coemansia javaensis]
MTSAGEYALLDSGRAGLSFDPAGPAHALRPQPEAARLDDALDAGTPMSLDLIAEMIKEEIRQASSLRQALDRVNAETECMSQRVSHLSLAGDGADLPAQPGAADPAAAPRGRRHSRRPGPPKKVQFTVPDDVRFRWLGIFHRPPDPADSDGDGDGGREQAALAPALPPASASQVTRAELAGNVATGMHAHKPPDAAGHRGSGGSSGSDNSGNGGCSADPAEPAEGPAPEALPPPAPAISGQTPPALQPPPAAAAAAAVSGVPRGPGPAESDSGSQGLANSSLEAVYGGSGFGSQDLAQRPPAISGATGASVAARAAAAAAGEHRGGRAERVQADGASADRPAHPLAAGAPAHPGTEAAADAYALGSAPGGSRYATVAGRGTRTSSKQPAAAAAAAANDRRQDRLGRSSSNGGLFGAKRQARAGSAFSKPSLATTRVTVSKASLPLAPAVPPDLGPRLPDAAELWERLQLAKSDRHRASAPHAAGDYKARRISPHLQRSESAHPIDPPAAVVPDAARRRRSSFDGSSISARGSGGLAAQAAAAAADSTDDAAANAQPGLQRRVTMSSVQRRSHGNGNGNGSSHQSRAAHDDHAGGILGGTKVFFRQRLRPRTNSSNPHMAELDDSGSPGEGAAAARGARARDSGHAKRPRRRSDAEVKSRFAVPPSPLHPIPADAHIGGGAAGCVSAAGDVAQRPSAPRASADPQAEWVAISPASPAHNDGVAAPRDTAAAGLKRPSHDEPASALPRRPRGGRDAARGLRAGRPSADHHLPPPLLIESDSTESPPHPSPPAMLLEPHPATPLHAAPNNKRPSAEPESTEYHMRRLGSRKGRRSSFLSTISSMLGRKE